MSITFVKTSGKEVAELVEDLKDVADGHSNAHVHVAALILAIVAQKPDVDPQTMQSVVSECSKWLATRMHSESQAVN